MLYASRRKCFLPAFSSFSISNILFKAPPPPPPPHTHTHPKSAFCDKGLIREMCRSLSACAVCPG